MKDGIYYILLADLVGSTASGAEAGDAFLAARMSGFSKAARTALDNSRMKASSGIFVKRIGDAVLLVFSHFPDVVDWYLEFSGALELQDRHLGPLHPRICTHIGEVHFERGDPACLAVSQVCKIEKAARAGGLVLTDMAYQVARTSVYPKQFTFRPCGATQLPGCARPVPLHRLVEHSSIAFLVEKTHRARLAQHQKCVH